MKKKILLLFISVTVCLWASAQHKTPLQLYPQLFPQVQMQQVYADGKTFTDALPLQNPDSINRLYHRAMAQPDFNLKQFVQANFSEPYTHTALFTSNPASGLRRHIDTLWTVLQRNPDTSKNTSLIPLPYPYIVPGGRFREVYYWDSYFTMLGLQEAGRYAVMENMIDNFAWLLDNYGHIPNGNRTYYLTRSQPPFFSLMVELLAQHRGDSVLVKYLPQLLKEYSFWMDGLDTIQVSPAKQAGHLVMMPDGSLLNRYYDAGNYPREESYREDVLTAKESKQDSAAFYRNIRSAAESGWDFSSRWFADGEHLSTIQTTAIIPADLNCLLYNLESVIAKAYRLQGDNPQANSFKNRAMRRRQAILKYCVNGDGLFTDYNLNTGKPSKQITIAMAFPLFFKIASAAQARYTAQVIESKFLKAGGVATTLKHTGQQWDAPNGWAPLQYITIMGLKNYGHNRLAKTIALRWINQNTIAFKQTGKLLEKYNIELQGDAAKAGGGEYPLQDGFGWTNGVLLKLMNMYGVQ